MLKQRNHTKSNFTILITLISLLTAFLPTSPAVALQTRVTTLGINDYKRVFSSPIDVATLKDGSLLVLDIGTYKIFKITNDRISLFTSWDRKDPNIYSEGAPCAMEVNNQQQVFVVNCGQTFVNRYSSNGELQGRINISSSIGGKRGFDWGAGMALDAQSNIYLSDEQNNVILKVDSSNQITSIYAGIPGTAGTLNGPSKQATFNLPRGLVISKNGTLYVADTISRRVRAIDQSGNVTTLGGDICSPVVVGLNEDDEVLVLSEYYCGARMAKLSPTTGAASSIIDDSRETVGSVPYSLIAKPIFGLGAAAEVKFLKGTNSNEDRYVITDSKNGNIKFFDSSGQLRKTIGNQDTFGVSTTSNRNPIFIHPNSIFSLRDGRNLVVDNSTLRLISTSGEVERTIHLPWGCPGGAELSSDGTLFCAQGNSIGVRFPNGSTSQIGRAEPGFQDGTSAEARFNWINGLYWDGNSLFSTEYNNHAIREINRIENTNDFKVKVLSAGNSPIMPTTAQPKNSTVYSWPAVLAGSKDGTIYLAEGGWSRMRRLDPGVNGLVHVISGNFPSWPAGIVVDGNQKVMVVTANGGLFQVVSNSLVKIGGNGLEVTEGDLNSAYFFSPHGMSIDAGGNLLVTDTEHSLVRKIEGLDLTPNKLYDPNKLSILFNSMTSLEKSSTANNPEDNSKNQKPTKPILNTVNISDNKIYISVNIGNDLTSRSEKVYLVAPKLGATQAKPTEGTILGNLATWILPFKNDLAGIAIPLEVVGQKNGLKSDSLITVFDAPQLNKIVQVNKAPSAPTSLSMKIVGSYAIVNVKSKSKIGALATSGYLYSKDLGIVRNNAIQGEIIGENVIFEVPVKTSMQGRKIPVIIFLRNNAGDSAPLTGTMSIPSPPKQKPQKVQVARPNYSETIICIKGTQTRTFVGAKCPPGWEKPN